ncbi:MAG: tape measure protein [Janthinobacterium lividum]
MADILASVSVVLGAEISGFKAAMADARRELKGLVQFSEGVKDIGSNLTSAVSVPLALMATGALVASAKLEGLKNGLQAIAQQELGKQGITGLVGVQVAAQQTSERLKELQVIAKAPGLGLETAEQADIRLRAVGTSAAQSAKEIKAFANAIATTGGGRTEFQTVTTQLSQLTAKGKVLAQDLRPIIEAAPAVAAALQTLYGTVDSETISASLVKQGKSSKDFVAILTDELLKLPQVTGGLKAIYENDLDAILVASAKVGDGIARAFNLQAVGEKLGDEITELGDSFADLPPATQGAVVALGGVVAATGPVLVALGTLGVGLPAVKAGFVAAQSGVALLGTGLTALANPVTLVVVGLAALAAGAYYLATANDRALDSYREQAKATRQLTTDVAPLLDRYDELKAKTTLTVNEQAELRAVVEKVTAIMPAAGAGIDGYGNYIGLATDKAREFIKASQGLDKAIALQSLPAQQQKLQDLTEAYDRLLRERDQLNRGSFNGVKVGDLGAAFLVDFQRELGTTATALEKQRRLVAELGSAAGITATEFDALGATLPGLAANLAKLGTPFPVFDITGGTGAIAAQIGLLKRLHAELTALKEDQQNAGTEKQALALNPQIKSLQDYISRLEGADKGSKKVADAIKKLREELARLTALDNLLGNTPTELQVLERRADTLVKGLRTLVDSGVSPASKAFQGFEQDMIRTSQAADKILAGIGKNMPDGEQLELKPVNVKSLIPQNIGDTLPEDVARSLGDYAKRAIPFELPVAAKINMQGILEAMQPVKLLSKELVDLSNIKVKLGFTGSVSKELNTELLSIGAAFKQIDGAAQLGIQFDEAGAKAGVLQSALQNLLAQGTSPLDNGLQELSAKFKQLSVDAQATSAVKGAIMDTFSGISTAFADATSGVQDIGSSLMQTLLGTVGNLATELGGILLAAGLGIEALKVSLATFQGVGAIAAGLGLLAIGGIAKGAAANLGKSAGGGATSTPTASNYGQNSSSSQTIKVIAEFRLRNQELVAIGRSQTFRSQVTD